MNSGRVPNLVVAVFVTPRIIAIPVSADEIKGTIKSLDQSRSEFVITDEKTEKDVTVSLSALSKGLGKGDSLKSLTTGRRVAVDNVLLAGNITLEDNHKAAEGQKLTILQEFWHNFTHNLFKPLLLFFYLGFLVPILKVQFEFPYANLPGPDDLSSPGDRLARR
jgi:uncharacterized protein